MTPSNFKPVLVLFFSLFFLYGKSYAQDPHFSQFFNTPLNLNPALTGMHTGTWRFTAIHKDQWPSIPKAYITVSGSIDFKIPINYEREEDNTKARKRADDFIGIGITGLSDKSGDGAINSNLFALSASYHRSLDKQGSHTLGAGFMYTYNSTTVDFSKLYFGSQLTPTGFSNSMPSSVNINSPSPERYHNLRAGLIYSYAPAGEVNSFYAGISVSNVLRKFMKTNLSFIGTDTVLSSRWTANAGGTFPLSYWLAIYTAGIFQYQNKATETMLGGSFVFNLNGKESNPTNLYFGSWVRFRDAIVAPYVGLEFNGFNLGFSYDINTSGLSTATLGRGGPEFSIIYIHNRKRGCPPGSTPEDLEYRERKKLKKRFPGRF